MGWGAYSLAFNGLTSLTTTPFLQIATPATQGIEILSFELYQETSETSQQEAITFTRRSTASTLPTATTPIAIREKDGISLLTGSTTTNAVGIATVTGTLVSTPLLFSFNVLNGFMYMPVPEARLTVGPSGFLTIQFKTAPAANTWSGQLVYREMV
jgi:hypothetical protein